MPEKFEEVSRGRNVPRYTVRAMLLFLQTAV